MISSLGNKWVICKLTGSALLHCHVPLLWRDSPGRGLKLAGSTGLCFLWQLRYVVLCLLWWQWYVLTAPLQYSPVSPHKHTASSSDSLCSKVNIPNAFFYLCLFWHEYALIKNNNNFCVEFSSETCWQNISHLNKDYANATQSLTQHLTLPFQRKRVWLHPNTTYV